MKRDRLGYTVSVVCAVLGLISAIAGTVTDFPMQSREVGTSSTQIAPDINPPTISDRSSTAAVYAVGDYVNVWSNGTGTAIFSQSLRYWCITAGTSAATNLASWSSILDVTDGTVTWRPIPRTRNDVLVQNDSTGVVYIGWGAPAVMNRGTRLNANGGSVSRPDYDSAVYAISGSATANVTITEQPR